MNYLILSLIAGGVVAYLVYKNVSHITNHLDTLEDDSFEIYSKYSLFINNIIKEIKNEIDFPKEDAKFVVDGSHDTKEVSEELSTLIRKLVFFETVMAKKNSKEKTEQELFTVLIRLEELVKKDFVDGEKLSVELKTIFQDEFDSLSI